MVEQKCFIFNERNKFSSRSLCAFVASAPIISTHIHSSRTMIMTRINITIETVKERARERRERQKKTPFSISYAFHGGFSQSVSLLFSIGSFSPDLSVRVFDRNRSLQWQSQISTRCVRICVCACAAHGYELFDSSSTINSSRLSVECKTHNSFVSLFLHLYCAHARPSVGPSTSEFSKW